MMATQERHLAIDEVEQRGIRLLRVWAHEAAETLHRAASSASWVREEHAGQARQVEAFIGEAGGDDDRQLAGAGAIEQLLADRSFHLAREHRRRDARRLDGIGERMAVVDA